MEGSSDIHCFRSCTPVLERVLAEVGTSLSDPANKVAESVGPFSVQDIYNIPPCMFTSVTGGMQAIELWAREFLTRKRLNLRSLGVSMAEIMP